MIKILNKIKYLCIFLAAAMMLAPAFAQRESPASTPQLKQPQQLQQAQQQRVQPTLASIAVKDLPREARDTLTLIEKNGPFPYDRDGIVFGNFEKRLPIKERGYYREYTVKTPGLNHRGARRIVTGKGGERYYSEDHYQTFKRIVP